MELGFLLFFMASVTRARRKTAPWGSSCVEPAAGAGGLVCCVLRYPVWCLATGPARHFRDALQVSPCGRARRLRINRTLSGRMYTCDAR